MKKNLEMRSLLRCISKELQEVERRMREAIGDEAEPLAYVREHLLNRGGKRLRPALVILASKFHPADDDEVLNLAAAVEMLHTATLVHDDMIDNSFLRRGNPTLNTSWGKGVVVLVGDYLFASAAGLAARTQNPRIVSLFSRTLMLICSGELKEALNHWRPTKEDYYQRIYNKTASLFAAAGEAGGLLAEAPEEEVRALREYGHNLGMAFQIMDDILDFVGDEDEMGKPVGSDLRQQIITLPTITFLECNPQFSSLEEMIGPEGDQEEDIDRLVAQVKESGAIISSRAEAQAFTSKAKEALNLLPPNQCRQTMLDLADSLLVRRS